MLTVKSFQRMAKKLSLEDFCWQLGPFTLIQRPSEQAVAGLQELGLPRRMASTRLAMPQAMRSGAEVVRDFENLSVATVPPLGGQDELSVGRQPDCDLVVDDPSVSKKQAVIRWNAAKGTCTVKDLDSTNGTLINSEIRVKGEMPLHDGDIVTFGEVHFWYLRTPTLYDRLSGAKK